MSERPGYDLESYVMWQHDLIVGEDAGANPSLELAEAVGITTRRIQISRGRFREVLVPYEPHREYVERKLLEFDDDRMSWRGYAYNAFDDIPIEVWQAAEKATGRKAAESVNAGAGEKRAVQEGRGEGKLHRNPVGDGGCSRSHGGSDAGGVADVPTAGMMTAREVDLRAGLIEALAWIDGWSPNFTYDEEWPRVRERLDLLVGEGGGA